MRASTTGAGGEGNTHASVSNPVPTPTAAASVPATGNTSGAGVTPMSNIVSVPATG